jgi:3-methyladenine DNA glycosylase AlkD
MTLKETMKRLETLGNETVRTLNYRNGAGKDQFGVKLGDIRGVAKKIKTDHALALALWKTGNLDAQLLATLILQPTDLSADELDRMVRAVTTWQLADWLNSSVVARHPAKESLRQQWMTAKHPMLARAGWRLTADRISDEPEGLDLPALLDRIEAELAKADPAPQWTMNSTLAQIGIHCPKLRQRALAIGEKLGIYRDYPCARGCTSPFAPIWINALVNR